MGEWPKRKRGDEAAWADAELEALWRPYPEFIGPVAPPMWLWLRDEEKQRQWRIAMNLEGTFNQPTQIEMSLEPPKPSSTMQG